MSARVSVCEGSQGGEEGRGTLEGPQRRGGHCLAVGQQPVHTWE